MIGVNDISPQRITELEREVAALRQMIYDLDGKSLRVNTLNGDRIIAKTIDGDKITGGTIEGSLIKTRADTDYIHLHDQYIEIYHNNQLTMQIGHFSGYEAYPSIRFFLNGVQVGILGTYENGVAYSGDINFEGAVYFNGSARLNGQPIATVAPMGP